MGGLLHWRTPRGLQKQVRGCLIRPAPTLISAQCLPFGSVFQKAGSDMSRRGHPSGATESRNECKKMASNTWTSALTIGTFTGVRDRAELPRTWWSHATLSTTRSWTWTPAARYPSDASHPPRTSPLSGELQCLWISPTHAAWRGQPARPTPAGRAARRPRCPPGAPRSQRPFPGSWRRTHRRMGRWRSGRRCGGAAS